MVKVDRRVGTNRRKKATPKQSKAKTASAPASKPSHDEAYPGHWKIGCRKVCTQRVLNIVYPDDFDRNLTEGHNSGLQVAQRESPQCQRRRLRTKANMTQSRHSIRTGLERRLLRAERFINEFTRAAQESELEHGQPMPSWIQRFRTPPALSAQARRSRRLGKRYIPLSAKGQ